MTVKLVVWVAHSRQHDTLGFGHVSPSIGTNGLPHSYMEPCYQGSSSCWGHHIFGLAQQSHSCYSLKKGDVGEHKCDVVEIEGGVESAAGPQDPRALFLAWLILDDCWASRARAAEPRPYFLNCPGQSLCSSCWQR